MVQDKMPARHLKFISDAASQLLLSDEPLEVVGDVFESLASHLGLEVYAYYLLDDERGILRLKRYGGISAGVAKALEGLAAKPLRGTVGREAQSLAAHDSLKASNALSNFCSSAGLTADCCFPLIARRELIGILCLGSRPSGTRLSKQDLQLVRTVADQAAAVGERARRIEKLERDAGELRDIDEGKDELAAFISHELKNSLSVIQSASRMLRVRQLADEDRKSLLTNIEDAATRVVRVLDRLLLLSRLELGQGIETEPILLPKAVERAVRNFTTTRPERKLSVKVEEKARPVTGEETYVDEVLQNLLENADKYSPKAEPIEIRHYSLDGEQRVVVRDYGAGVPDDQLETIFERFYRAPGRTARRPGEGLGLRLCRRLMGAQSGRIWAQKPRDGGLEMCFVLPECSPVQA